MTALERFTPKYKVARNGCHIWQGAKDGAGYGMFWHEGGSTRAHIFIYEYYNGKKDPRLHLDHFICDNPSCVNVAHLKLVTPRQNILRGRGACAVHARQTHCSRGHAFNEQNTYKRKGAGRACRKCRVINNRAYKKRKRAKVER